MTARLPLPARADLRDLIPYTSPQPPARYRMNTNESPYPPPEALVKEVAEELQAIALNRYPDRDAAGLFEAICGHAGWPSEGLWVANGSNEVFLHLFLAFGGPGRTAMTFEPTYSLHSVIPRIAGTSVVQLPRRDDFHIDMDDAVKGIQRERPEIVIICSPNNPTGGVEPLSTIRVLAEEATGIVVVDEAYIEFAEPSETAFPLLQQFPNLILTKTFSKAWRLAGVRLGYMLAAPGFVSELRRVRLPYHLSAITQVVGEAAIRHATETLDIVHAITRERDKLAVELQALGVETFPSRANFILFRVDEPDRVWSGLLQRGVIVRNYSGQPGLTGCLRVTAGLPEETDAFLDAMAEVLDE